MRARAGDSRRRGRLVAALAGARGSGGKARERMSLVRCVVLCM